MDLRWNGNLKLGKMEEIKEKKKDDFVVILMLVLCSILLMFFWKRLHLERSDISITGLWKDL